MKVVVEYDHDPADPSPIYLSVSPDRATPGEWQPAYCDTVDGRRVVWIRVSDDAGPYIWLRDRRGGRRIEDPNFNKEHGHDPR